MRHEEYVLRLESFGDSPADVEAVLRHVDVCAICRQEHRFAERKIAKMESRRPGALEPILRWAAAAAILAMLIAALRRPSDAPRTDAVRYRIVGDASGVVAYTPGGVVMGTAGAPARRGAR